MLAYFFPFLLILNHQTKYYSPGALTRQSAETLTPADTERPVYPALRPERVWASSGGGAP